MTDAKAICHVHHIPSGEDWVILGINRERNEVCAAGWPPSIGKLSDCRLIENYGELSEKELQYRNQTFGTNWE